LLAVTLLAPAATAHAAPLAAGFEGGLAGWRASGLWHVEDHPELVTVSPAIGGLLSDVPAGASLPAAWEGTHAAWFGDRLTGTYCAGFLAVRQHPSDGCTSDGVVRGTLESPPFALAAGPASLTFHAWWEISGGSPDLTDLMIVDYSTDGGQSWTQAGRLNPDAPPWGSRHQQWSEAGHKGSGEWRAYTVDLTPAANHGDVRVRFRFDSVDEYGQGFRGLLVDGVTVDGDEPPTLDAQLIAGVRFAALDQNGSPVRGRSVLIENELGSVTYTLPGESDARALTKPTLVPVGTFIDTGNGRVKLTSATDDSGGTQGGSFYKGLFQVLQQPDDALVDLVLRGGSFPHCKDICDARSPGARASAVVRRIRRLWGDARGRFRTRGRYACATVRGTNWLVEDRTSGTLVRVLRGSVVVTDHVLKRAFIVNAGESYFARALFVNKQQTNPRYQRHYSILTTRGGRIVHVYETRRVVLSPARGGGVPEPSHV